MLVLRRKNGKGSMLRQLFEAYGLEYVAHLELSGIRASRNVKVLRSEVVDRDPKPPAESNVVST